MTTLTAAIAALVAVGKADFLSRASDPTYGAFYATMLWSEGWPFAEAKNAFPAIYIYENGGNTERQGLSTVKMWRYSRVRVEAFANSKAEVQQAFETLRTAWITDYNYYVGNGTVGQG